MNSSKNFIFASWVCLIVLILFISLFAFFYISQERYFYYADLSHYSSKTEILTSAFKNSLKEGISHLYQSLSSNYNDLPCLLLVPSFLIFGESRYVFIITSSLVYLLPYSLVIGALAAKLLKFDSRAVFWSTAFLTILTPFTWIALLRGYVDLGGAVLIGLAILIYLKNIRLSSGWQSPMIGILLALAILFRRHFAYSVRAFFLAMILQGLITFWSDRKADFSRQV